MLINVSELFSAKGKTRSYTPELEMETFSFSGEEYQVVKKEPVNLTATSLGERRVQIEGEIRLSLMVPCSRCLDPVTVPFELPVSQELDFNLDEEERAAELDEQPYVFGSDLDVDGLARSELILNFPSKVLCREDCKGICNQCGANLNRETCSCVPQGKDPRMAAIQDIFKNWQG